MSNLGMYQSITTWSKKLGGPKQFLTAVAIGGYVVIRLSEAGVKKAVKIVRRNSTEKTSNQVKVFVVHTESKSSEGLIFKVGDKFSVLEIDKGSVLIEKFGESDNPYFVSAELLNSISNFNYSSKDEV